MLVSRSGTCTAADCDDPDVVRSRVQFLLSHPEILPGYSVFQSNCECVAVWCKTGSWATLQGASILLGAVGLDAWSTLAATVLAAGTSVTTTVPAAGVWGWLEFTTDVSVSLLVAEPWLLPTIITGAVVTVGAPAIVLMRAKQQWKNITKKLNTAFEKSRASTRIVVPT